MGSVVNPIVDNMDVDEVVERVDVNHLVEEIDVERLLSRIDPDALLDRVDPDRLLDRLDPDRLLDRVDPNRLLDRVDPDRLLDRVDPDRLMDRVDPDRLLDRVDPGRLLNRVDPNPFVGRLDPNPLLESVDVERLLDRIDVNQLIEHVDVERLLDRIDPNALLDRIDPNALLERVDPDALLERVDVNALVERTELGAIIARSTTGVFTQLLDVGRAQIVIADQIAQGIPARVLRGARRELPPSPGHPDDAADEGPSWETWAGSTTPGERAVVVQGRAAGSVSRFLAFLVDQFTIAVLFAVVSWLTSIALEVVTGTTVDVDDARLGLAVAYGLWVFAYTAGSLAVSGRTIGKAVLGLLVVRSDGRRLDGRHASIRTIAFPLSFLLFGIGFLLGLVRRDRRQLHDLIGSTSVVYAWDARTAALRASALVDPDPALSASAATATGVATGVGTG